MTTVLANNGLATGCLHFVKQHSVQPLLFELKHLKQGRISGFGGHTDQVFKVLGPALVLKVLMPRVLVAFILQGREEGLVSLDGLLEVVSRRVCAWGWLRVHT